MEIIGLALTAIGTVVTVIGIVIQIGPPRGRACHRKTGRHLKE